MAKAISDRLNPLIYEIIYVSFPSFLLPPYLPNRGRILLRNSIISIADLTKLNSGLTWQLCSWEVSTKFWWNRVVVSRDSIKNSSPNGVNNHFIFQCSVCFLIRNCLMFSSEICTCSYQWLN